MTDQLVHLLLCPQQRVERISAKDHAGRVVQITRCVDCGEQAVSPPSGSAISVDADLWANDPGSVARSLTPDERWDPEKNPLHPHAGFQGRPPARRPGGVVVDPQLAQQLRRQRRAKEQP